MKYTFNDRKATVLAIAFLLLIAVSNCSLEPNIASSNTPVRNESTGSAATSKPPTLDPTKLAPTVTSTATQVVIPPVERRCMQSAEERLPAIEGQVVLAGYRLEARSSWIDGQSYLYDLRTEKQTLLGVTQFETVSPDSDLLAYYEKSSNLVVISKKNGERIMELPADNTIFPASLFPAYWIDSQRLALNKVLENSSRGDNASLLVLNPFTNEQQEWSPEYPEQDHDSYYDWRVTSNLVFNPALNRLVYPTIMIDTFVIILRDVNTDREIARIYGGALRHNTPQWSPDGNYFVTSAPIRGGSQSNFININDNFPYIGGTDLLLISPDGQIKRLTYFTVTNLMSVTHFVWSPNGDKIAFLLWDVLHSYAPNLMIVDIETGIVSDYCQLAEPPLDVQNIPVSLPNPVWSPDGRYLLFTEINEEYQYRVRLLELESGKAWGIAKDVSAMGWMMTP